MAKISVFIPNTENNMRCVQASFRMVMHALTGKDPGKEKADEMTGFREGHGTWQFRMLLSFAQSGFIVINHEKFNFEGFLKNPEEAIRAQSGETPTSDKNILDTDIASEKRALEKCLKHPNILLIESIPNMKDLRLHLSEGGHVMCVVNSLALDKREGYLGHMVVVEDLDTRKLVIHDPGLPPQFNRTVDIDTFENAWKNPTVEMANLIVVYPRHLKSGHP